MTFSLACNKKKILYAYHTHCLECATEKGICAKCHESSTEIVNPFAALNTSTSPENEELEAKIQRLSERKRRSYLRKVESGDEEGAAAILDFVVESESDSEDLDDDDEDDTVSIVA